MREDLQDHKADRRIPKPYMLYGDRERDSEMPEERMLRDLEYFQSLYPGQMKQLQGYVMRACDAMDFKNSPMYDEYPDRIMIDQVCDSICGQIRGEGTVKMPGSPQGAVEPGMEEMPGTVIPDRTETGAMYENREVAEVEAYEAAPAQIQQLTGNVSQGPGPERPPWGPPPPPRPPRPPWGPPPPRPPQPPWGPPPPRPPQPPWGPPPPRPPQPPWGPPPPPRPPQPPWGPPPPPRPPQPPWGPPPPRPPQPPWGPSRPSGPNWLNDIIKVLLLNEMHRRRCGSGFC